MATYDETLTGIVELIAAGRRRAARAVNAEMVATYWLVGRSIVEEEQRGAERAGYGEELVARLATDLMARFGRGFGKRNLFRMKAFYLLKREIVPTASTLSRAKRKVSTASTLSRAKRKVPTLSTLSARAPDLQRLSSNLPLPWSHDVLLLAVKNEHAREFYEVEALRGGWSSIRCRARLLDRCWTCSDISTKLSV